MTWQDSNPRRALRREVHTAIALIVASSIHVTTAFDPDEDVLEKLLRWLLPSNRAAFIWARRPAWLVAAAVGTAPSTLVGWALAYVEDIPVGIFEPRALERSQLGDAPLVCLQSRQVVLLETDALPG